MLPLALFALSQPGGPVFESRLAGKPSVTSPILTLSDDLVSARRVGQSRPAWPRGPHLILANGDRIAATVVGGDGRGVWVQTAFTGGDATDRLVIPFTTVAAVWFSPPPADVPPDPARYPWAEGLKRTDAVLLTSGDVRRGVVEAFAADGVRVAKSGLLPTARIAAVAFDPSLGRTRPVAGRHWRAVLTDGSRLTLTAATAEGGTVRGKLAAGPTVSLPAEQLVALDVVGGPAVYLSDLKPVRQTVEGYTGLAWPWVADRSAKGHPIRVGADTFDKGIGTHPRAVLMYRLDGKYRRFEATVGPDPLTGGGAVTVRVLADGRDVTPPALGAISVDVSGAKELTLDVGFGPFGDVRADVNWGDAKLIQ